MDCLACIGLFAPLLGFAILLATSYSTKRGWAHFIGCGSIFLSFIAFCGLFASYLRDSSAPYTLPLFQWIHTHDITAQVALYIDPLSIWMALLVTGIGFLIHIYSIGYMEHDRDIYRYFACLNFFIFAMLLLILSEELLVTFVGWEGVGLASYLLIGFWYERPTAASAAVKAFVMNRIGDLGFLLALFLTFYLFGTSSIVEISNRASQEFAVGDATITLLTLLYFIGAIGKSAQLPLQTWLPDAMAGPTPVSALIHAATMVAAGVYLIVRLHDVFTLAPVTLEIIGIVGGTTALFASLCALAQTELKRVLAYSTVSQIGFMFLACGIADFYGAIFHLSMHAFIKALLFLAAGNVLHALHGMGDMRDMGGLMTKLPKTHLLFLTGTLALSGIPPLAAFFSKELILEQEYLLEHYTLFYIGLLASIFTGVYLTRAYCLTFLGPSETPKTINDHIKEVPYVMIIPMLFLAFFSMSGGAFGFASGHNSFLERFLGTEHITLADTHHSESFFTPQTMIAMAGSCLAVVGTAIFYVRLGGPRISTMTSYIFLLRNGFYIDAIYFLYIVRPLRTLSKFIYYYIELFFSQRSLQWITQSIHNLSVYLHTFQNSQIRSYTAWLVIGMLFTLFYLAL